MKTRRFGQERKSLFLFFFKSIKDFYRTLTEETSKSGCSTINADWEADLLIVQTTSSQSKENNIALIGEDTKFFVLLLHNMDLAQSKGVYLLNDKVNNTGKI